MTSRRGFLIAAAALLAAPAVIRIPGLLMPVRKVIEPVDLFAMMHAHYDKMVNPPIISGDVSIWPIEWGTIDVLEIRPIARKDYYNRFNLARA